MKDNYSLVKPISQHEDFTMSVEQSAYASASFVAVGVTAAVTTALVSNELISATPSNPIDVIDPNIHLLNDSIQISRDVVSGLVFSSGILSSVGTAAFAIANSIFQYYKNLKYIQQAEQHLQDQIENVELAALLVKMKKTKGWTATRATISAFCQKQCLAKITKDTLTDGAVGITTLAVSIFSIGFLIPIAFPITSILTIATLAIGAVTTGIITYINRKQLRKKLAAAAKIVKIKKLCHKQAAKFKSTLDIQQNHLNKVAQHEAAADTISAINFHLFATSLLIRLSALAKFALLLVESIATVASSVVGYARSAIDAVINYRNRQRYLENLPKLITHATLPWIDLKSFYLFGQTPLEKFITAEKHCLIAKHNLPNEFANLSAREIIKSLSSINSRIMQNVLLIIRKNCIEHFMQKDFHAFCEANLRKDLMNTQNSLLKEYLVQHVADFIAFDVKTSGRINTAKIAISTGLGGSLIFPPLTGIFWAASCGIMLVGEVITQWVAHTEVKKFKKAAAQLIDKVITPQDSEKSADATAIEAFMSLLKPQVICSLSSYFSLITIHNMLNKNKPLAVKSVPTTTTIKKSKNSALISSSLFLKFNPKIAKRSSIKPINVRNLRM
jgi:hypothetical protein